MTNSQWVFVMNRRRSISPSTFLLTREEAEQGKTIKADISGVIPVFCPLNTWCRVSGLSRSATFKGINEGWLPTIKLAKSRLVDF